MLAVVLFAVAASTGSAQTAQELESFRAEFTVLVIVRPVIPEFNALVLSYFEMRALLQAGLPVRRVTDNPDENIRAERALARRIRKARDDADRGDIFTRPISADFRTILERQIGPAMLATIMDDNPGAFSHRINGSYPKRQPLSTMPAAVLAVLPPLPDGLEYRFLGHDLILHDTRANVILDRITCALACIEVVD